MSQDALAEKLNVTRQAISNWENAKTQPDADTLKNLGIIFNVTVDEIINNDFYKSENRKNYYFLVPLSANLLSLIHCILAFFGYYNPFGAMSSVVSASVIALIMYLSIEYSIKNRDFTMLAGHKKIYEKDVYRYERKLRSMSLQVAGLAVLLNILYFFMIFTKKEDQIAALERHLEFFNTHPYVAAPIMGVTLALEEERANGVEIDDAAIQGVKIGMMGPLAGIGDPVFWFTVRPILGALGASLAASGNLVGPLLFFFGWNAIRMAFLWYTQEFGYKAGSEITKDMSGGILKDITKGASILGMFILAVLVQRWVSINFTVNLPGKQLAEGAYINFPEGPVSGAELKGILGQALGGLSLDKIQPQTLQGQLNSLIPGLMGLLLTFLCMWLLKKKVSPISIILALFAVGIAARFFGIM